MLADFETRILAQIDDRVEHGSDDELFAGGYLRGHLTLAVAELEEENDTSVEALYQRVEESIKKPLKLVNYLHLIKYWCSIHGNNCSIMYAINR